MLLKYKWTPVQIQVFIFFTQTQVSCCGHINVPSTQAKTEFSCLGWWWDGGCEDRQNLMPWPGKAHPLQYGAERLMVPKASESGHQDCTGVWWVKPCMGRVTFTVSTQARLSETKDHGSMEKPWKVTGHMYVTVLLILFVLCLYKFVL